MKKIIVICALVCLALSMTGCRNAGKYVDDAARYVDDVLSGRKSVKVKMKRAPQQHTCRVCSGSGRVYDAYGYAYTCSNCDGDGKVLIQ